ncbi:MAG: hypothetical protein PHI90_11025, partial [Clostridia bacterium]|nr:hypothetical protein [Clostridia bacterium]
GNITETATNPKGNITIKTYDKAGRLKYVTADNQTTTYTYYDNGNRESVIYPNGLKEEYTYYDNNQLRELKNIKADGTIMDTYIYAYDNAGNQTSKEEMINGVIKGTTNYEYDELNRLAKVTEPNGKITTYTYDYAGNRAKETITQEGVTVENEYSYNEQNRLTTITTQTDDVVTETTTYSYDNNGNQLTTSKNGQVTITNTYDLVNQLIKTAAGETTVINIYNGEGLRVAKEVNGERTQYLYEYDKVVLELDEAGNEVGRNTYGLNLLRRTVEGESYYYMYNGHADVTALIDATTGDIAGTYYYDAFGNILEQTGDVNNSITYAGYQYDEETGLYYLNARMYDPKIARFLQEDTYSGNAADPLSLNCYTYCNNNPVSYYDPDGHFLRVIVGGFVGGLIGGISGYIASDGDWKQAVAGATGGVVSGILVASGAGAVVAGVKTGILGTGSTIASMAAIGATGGATGSVTTQVTEQILDNPQMEITDVKIDINKVITSALVGTATGALSGGIIAANNAIETSGKAINAYLGQRIENTSQILMQQNASMGIIQNVQTQYMAGMANVGLSTNQLIMTTTIIDELGIPIVEEIMNNNGNDSRKVNWSQINFKDIGDDLWNTGILH